MSKSIFNFNKGEKAITLLGEPQAQSQPTSVWKHPEKKWFWDLCLNPKEKNIKLKRSLSIFQDFSQRGKISAGLLRQMVFQGKVLYTISPWNAWFHNFRELLSWEFYQPLPRTQVFYHHSVWISLASLLCPQTSCPWGWVGPAKFQKSYLRNSNTFFLVPF